MSRPPTTVYCYICGRQYGSKSIDFHQPKCTPRARARSVPRNAQRALAGLEKWRTQNERLPRSQRKAEPLKPEIVRDRKCARPFAPPPPFTAFEI